MTQAALSNFIYAIANLPRGPYRPPQYRRVMLPPITPVCVDYFKREVLPHVPDAWIAWDKTRIGFEIPFNRHFYTCQPPRDLVQIEAELKTLETDIVRMLGELTA